MQYAMNAMQLYVTYQYVSLCIIHTIHTTYQDSEPRKATWRPSPCEVHPTRQTCRHPNIQFVQEWKKSLLQNFLWFELLYFMILVSVFCLLVVQNSTHKLTRCLKMAFAQWNLVSMLGKFWSLRFGCQVWAPGRVIAFVVQHGEKSPLLFSHLLTVRISTISALNAKMAHYDEKCSRFSIAQCWESCHASSV